MSPSGRCHRDVRGSTGRGGKVHPLLSQAKASGSVALRMAVSAGLILIWIMPQSRKPDRPRRARKRRRGPEGPLQTSPAAIAVITIRARTIIARRPIIPWAVVIRPRPVVPVIIRTPPAPSPGVADHADLLDVGDSWCRRCGRDRHGGCRRRRSEDAEQGHYDEASLEIHDVFLRLRACRISKLFGSKCGGTEM